MIFGGEVDFKFDRCKALHTFPLLIIYWTAVTGKLVAVIIHSNLNLEQRSKIGKVDGVHFENALLFISAIHSVSTLQVSIHTQT